MWHAAEYWLVVSLSTFLYNRAEMCCLMPRAGIVAKG
jgi:hypothetical protein